MHFDHFQNSHLGTRAPPRKCVFVFEETGSAVILDDLLCRFKSHGDILLGAKNPVGPAKNFSSSHCQVAISAPDNDNLALESSY